MTATVSVVTVCRNAAATLERTILSVRAQTGVRVEHIIIDGASTDGTAEILRRHADGLAHVVSENDGGLYHAMNKGLALTTGDYTGFLNADDAFANQHVLAGLMHAAARMEADAVYGDVLQIDAAGRPARLIRGRTNPVMALRRGFMPPHPSLYVRTPFLKELGGFNTGYRIGSDFDLFVRLLQRADLRTCYVRGIAVLMLLGGISTRNLRASHISSGEIVRACRANGLSSSLPLVLTRYPRKVWELMAGRMMAWRGVRFPP